VTRFEFPATAYAALVAISLGQMRLLIIFIFITQLTHGQIGEIKLVDFKYSACDEATLSNRLLTRISKKESSGNILTVDIATVATCCVKFEPIASTDKGILYLDFKENGTECECNCYYTLTYKIKGIKSKDIKIKFQNKDIDLSDEKYKTYPTKFTMLNGDTINFVDKYGLRQGKWMYSSDSLMTTGYFEALDDVPVKLITLYPDKTIKSMTSRDKIVLKDSNGKDYDTYLNYNYYVEYFESWTKKKECTSDNNSDSFKDGGQCKEWNEKGELVYEGVYRK
jgi:hypothetical protein